MAKAVATVEECHPEHLLQESKFLLTESLQELVKFLIVCSSLEGEWGEEFRDRGSLFYIELVTRITIAKRVGAVWRGLVDHLHRMISASSRTLGGENQSQLELASTDVQSLRILLAIQTGFIFYDCKQLSYELHKFLKDKAADTHSGEDWGNNYEVTLIDRVMKANNMIAKMKNEFLCSLGEAELAGKIGTSQDYFKEEKDELKENGGRRNISVYK